MSSAYMCDICGRMFEGKPETIDLHGGLKTHYEINFDACHACFRIINNTLIEIRNDRYGNIPKD